MTKVLSLILDFLTKTFPSLRPEQGVREPLLDLVRPDSEESFLSPLKSKGSFPSFILNVGRSTRLTSGVSQVSGPNTEERRHLLNNSLIVEQMDETEDTVSILLVGKVKRR